MKYVRSAMKQENCHMRPAETIAGSISAERASMGGTLSANVERKLDEADAAAERSAACRLPSEVFVAARSRVKAEAKG